MIDQMLESRAGNRRRNCRKLRDGTGPIGLTQSFARIALEQRLGRLANTNLQRRIRRLIWKVGGAAVLYPSRHPVQRAMAVKHRVFETERDFSLGYPVDGISELPPWRPEGKLGEIQYRRAGHHTISPFLPVQISVNVLACAGVASNRNKMARFFISPPRTASPTFAIPVVCDTGDRVPRTPFQN